MLLDMLGCEINVVTASRMGKTTYISGLHITLSLGTQMLGPCSSQSPHIQSHPPEDTYVPAVGLHTLICCPGARKARGSGIASGPLLLRMVSIGTLNTAATFET